MQFLTWHHSSLTKNIYIHISMYIQRVICAYITTVYIPVWFSDPFKGQATSNVWGSSWVTLNILECPKISSTPVTFQLSSICRWCKSWPNHQRELEVTNVTNIPTFDLRSRGNSPFPVSSHPCGFTGQETANSCPWEQEWQPVRTRYQNKQRSHRCDLSWYWLVNHGVLNTPCF